jgi:ribosomal protein S18 acetylase RimI-like enzyme
MQIPPVEVTDFPALDAFLADRIADSNLEVTKLTDVKDLALQIKDGTGNILAGLTGFTWGGTCMINNLWVHPGHRNLGLGRELMATAELHARERGCSQIVLSSHSFQAPRFYENLGFAKIGEIAEYPMGHSDLIFVKKLSMNSERAASTCI